jgi:trehalose 6-phosphate phosphatase
MALTGTQIRSRIESAESIWLFLDYDGTLAEFAPTPDHVIPDPKVIGLVSELVASPRISVTVISGRRLAHIQKLLPLGGLWLFGTYGVEAQTPAGEVIIRVSSAEIRPALDELKTGWATLIDGRSGFYLEDKGSSLALHARALLSDAVQMASPLPRQYPLRILGGHKFLEVCPRIASKGATVEYMLERFGERGKLPLYLGDDDKDEEAFGVIKEYGGITIRVSEEPVESQSHYRLENPEFVHQWLQGISPLKKRDSSVAKTAPSE